MSRDPGVPDDLFAPDCPGPLSPSSSRFRPAPGACDCHFHVFGPYRRFPLAANRGYTPPEASVGAYRRLMATLGLQRCVIVQPSVYGTDHACTLAAARALGGPSRCRVVGVVHAGTNRLQLDTMHGAGVRGVRVNTVSGGGPDADELRDVARMIAPRGWHLQLFMSMDLLAEAASLLRTLPVDIVIDHMGAPGADAWAHPGAPALLRLLEQGRTWIKLSGGYISSRHDAPWADMGRLARLFAASRPDRLVWGTNWPHPIRHDRMPGDNDILDALAYWVPDPLTTRRILVDNPSALYGFQQDG